MILLILCLLFVALSGWAILLFIMFHLKYDGKLIILQDIDGKHMFTLELDTEPMDMIDMERVIFKVVLVNGLDDISH